MQKLTDVLSLLRQVRSLAFDARSEAGTGWDGAGSGEVFVTEPAEGVVVFDESGVWQPRLPGRAAMRFKNVFRWSTTGDALRLEHLRFGPEHPVLLFDMVPNADGVWREASPHQCQEDCYTGSLCAEGEQLIVAWSVTGPRKRESIRYTYAP